MSLLKPAPKPKGDTAPTPAPAAASRKRPDLGHAELRLLPVGFDVPGHPCYIDPEQLPAYVAYLAQPGRHAEVQRNAREYPPTIPDGVDDRGRAKRRAPVSVDEAAHWIVLEGLRYEAARDARNAEQREGMLAHDRARHTCEVCGRFDYPARACDEFLIVDGGEVTRRAYGITGRSIMAHPTCAAALERVLSERVDDAAVRAFAATL